MIDVFQEYYPLFVGLAVPLGVVGFFWFRHIKDEQLKLREIQIEALETDLRNLRRQLDELPAARPPRSVPSASVDEVFPSALDVERHLVLVFADLAKKGGPIEICNLGLDLEIVLPRLRWDLLEKDDYRDVSYRGLAIDPEAEEIAALIGSGSDISGDYVRLVAPVLQEAFHRRKESLKERNISIEVRLYAAPAVLDGFMINGRHLYLGATQVRDGVLTGGGHPYVYLEADPSSPERSHLFAVFRSWFEYRWARARPFFDSRQGQAVA